MGQRYLELTRTRLTVMLAIYHEAITKTALAEASGESVCLYVFQALLALSC